MEDLDLDRFRPFNAPTRFVPQLSRYFTALVVAGVSPSSFHALVENMPDATVRASGYDELAYAFGKYVQIKEDQGLSSAEDFVTHASALVNGDHAEEMLRQQLEDPERMRTNMSLPLFPRVLVGDSFEGFTPAQAMLYGGLAQRAEFSWTAGNNQACMVRWIGASVDNFAYLEDLLKVRCVVIFDNYSGLVNPNNNLTSHINQTEGTNGPGLVPPQTDELQVYACPGQVEEDQQIVDLLKKYSHKKVAIVTRAAQDRDLVGNWLAVHHVDHRVLGEKLRLFRTEEFRFLLNFMRALVHVDSRALFGVISSEYGYRDVFSVDELKHLLVDARFGEVSLKVQAMLRDQPNHKAREFVEDFRGISMLAADERVSPVELVTHIVDKTQMAEKLWTPHNEEMEFKAQVLVDFLSIVRRVQGRMGGSRATLSDVLTELENINQYGGASTFLDEFVEGNQGAVTVATMHGLSTTFQPKAFDVLICARMASHKMPARRHSNVIPKEDVVFSVPRPEDHVGALGPFAQTRQSREEFVQEEANLLNTVSLRSKGPIDYVYAHKYATQAITTKPNKPSPLIPKHAKKDNWLTFKNPLQFNKKDQEEESPPPKIYSPPSSPIPMSYSRITTLEACPQRYSFAYPQAIPSHSTSYMTYGSALHEAVAAYHEGGDLQKSVQAFDETWEAAFDELFPVEGFIGPQHIEEMRQQAVDVVIPEFVKRKEEEKVKGVGKVRYVCRFVAILVDPECF